MKSIVRSCASILLLLGLHVSSAYSQNHAGVHDTLDASRIVDNRKIRDVGVKMVEIPSLRAIVSVTGDSDVIKYVQTLPGVSVGAEGSSAYYVRGGNIGSNVITLDGITLYGSSHLLGLSSAYPTDMIASADFRLGGFHGDEGNFTASHLDLSTVSGSMTDTSYSAFASTFMMGGSVSAPLVKDKLSIIGSLRISPIGPEFSAIRAIAGPALDSLSKTRAVVYDAFAKVSWTVDPDQDLSLSVFRSRDSYSYRYGNYSDERMGWNNLIINLRRTLKRNGDWSVKEGIAYNRFAGSQGLVREMGGVTNNLAIVSSLNELTADYSASRSGSKGKVSLGAKERLARFNPGSSSTYKGGGPLSLMDSPLRHNVSYSSITTVHGQLDWRWGKRMELMTSARLNVYGANEPGLKGLRWRVNPEAGVSAHMDITKWMAAEVSADWTSQYYHTLEGIPVGWSVDLLVPTSSARPPEHATQYYAGLFFSAGPHHITVGAYDKKMSGLVYFADAGQLFSSAISGWDQNIKVGTGTSEGVEFLYEMTGKRLNYRIAYTLSRTDRRFPEINGGLPFPAKFDRRHILNVSAGCKVFDRERMSLSLNGFFTYQSGHRETVVSYEYPATGLLIQQITDPFYDSSPDPGPVFDITYPFGYYTSVNNYEMPAYIRLDVGCTFSFKTRLPQELNVGLYNVLNRHNPFSIIYDDRTREWKAVSLLPAMPAFNYRIQF